MKYSLRRIFNAMIIRHTRSSLRRCQNTFLCQSLNSSSGSLLRRRQFHASRPNLFIDEGIQISSVLFHLVHDTIGVSWALSIPLTAALCQLAFTPLHYFIENNNLRRFQSANLLVAWQKVYQKQAAQSNPGGTEEAIRRSISEADQKLKAKKAQLQKDMGYRGSWLNWTVLTYVPVWLLNVSALRRMCGAAEQNTDDVSLPPDTTGIVLESEFLTDGALWFTDLSIADPTLVLPLTAGGLLWITLKQAGRNRSKTAKPSLGATLVRNFITTAVVLAAPFLIATGAPNAVVLAIIGSTLTAILRRAALDQMTGTVTAIPEAKPRKPVLKKQFR